MMPLAWHGFEITINFVEIIGALYFTWRWISRETTTRFWSVSSILFICCYKGRFLGLECKLPGGRLTKLQKRAIEKINRAGGVACRVESVEDVKRVIERVDLERSDTNA